MAPNTVNAQFLPTFFRNWDKEYQSNLPQVGPDMALFWSNVYTRFTPHEADTKPDAGCASDKFFSPWIYFLVCRALNS